MEGITAPGVPLFVVGDRYVIGFDEGSSEEALRALIRDAAGPAATPQPVTTIKLPWFGTLDARAHSLTVLALVVGLVDGVNPCATSFTSCS